MVASFYHSVTKIQIQIYYFTGCFDLQFEKRRGQTASSLLKLHTKTTSKHQLYQFTFGFWSLTDEMNGHFFQKSQLSPYVPSVLVCGSVGSQQKVAWPVVYRAVSSPLADLSFRLPTLFHQLATKNQIRIDTAGVYWLFWCVI